MEKNLQIFSMTLKLRIHTSLFSTFSNVFDKFNSICLEIFLTLSSISGSFSPSKLILTLNNAPLEDAWANRAATATSVTAFAFPVNASSSY